MDCRRRKNIFGRILSDDALCPTVPTTAIDDNNGYVDLDKIALNLFSDSS